MANMGIVSIVNKANGKEFIIKSKNLVKKIENATERSISIMCYLMRTQAFWDGNKRTAMLFANAEMIRNGAGIISVSGNQKTEFGELLTEFYETNNMEKLKKWIYNNAIDGIEF